MLMGLKNQPFGMTPTRPRNGPERDVEDAEHSDGSCNIQATGSWCLVPVPITLPGHYSVQQIRRAIMTRGCPDSLDESLINL